MGIDLLVLRVSNRCNLACDYCYAKDSKQVDMPFDVAKGAIDQVSASGDFLKVQLTGGEPLLNMPLIERLYAYGQESGRKLSFTLQTNGTLLSEAVCQSLQEMNIAVGVSLDGIHHANDLRKYKDGRVSVQDTLQGIGNLKKVGKSCNLMAVVSQTNVAHLSELLDIALYLENVGGIGLDILRTTRPHLALEAKAADFSAAIDLLLSRYEDFRRLGVFIGIKPVEKMRQSLKANRERKAYCYAQTPFSLAVDADGGVYPCSALMTQTHALGDLSSMPQNLHKKRPCAVFNSACKTCDLFFHCLGGCPANEDKELICILNQKIYRHLTLKEKNI